MAGRYWGEDEAKPQTSLSLEALHQLARRRARERARGRGVGVVRKKGRQDSSESSGEDEELEGRKQARLEVDEVKNAPERSSDGNCIKGLDLLMMIIMISEDENSSFSESAEEVESHDQHAVPESLAIGLDETSTPSLMPLGRERSGGGAAGNKTVQRQLPDWLLHPHVVENDIQTFSK